jgi:glycosyltransferase involved in cell wall biosynthesis
MSLKIWIINPYGNLPGERWREYRSTMIARAFEKAGHETIWWVSNFEHRSKTFRSNGWRDIQVTPGFRIRMVPSTGYTSHISLGRIRHERTFAKRVRERALDCDPPHVIILAEPALFVSRPVLDLVCRWHVNLVLDILDLWPELFHILLPKSLSWAGKIIFSPLYCRRAALLRRADAIVAVSRDYLAVAQRIAPDIRVEVVYCGVDVNAIRKFTSGPAFVPEVLGFREKPVGEIWAIYAGTLGNNYDIRTILKVAEMLESQNLPIRILIAGDGPLKREVTSFIASRNLSKTVYLGTVSVDLLTRVYGLCDMALSTYVAGSPVAIPTKAYDYLAAGLPLINSLERDLGDLVRAQHIGLQYLAENPRSLYEAILKLTVNTHLRRKMSRNSLRVSECFDADTQGRKFVSLVENICMVKR